MSYSLDRELDSLRNPIPKGVDLGWVESGKTVTPTDTNNPNQQSHNIMGQWAFNRASTRKLMPEERAIGQTIIACMNSGCHGPALDGYLWNTFGGEVVNRYEGLINYIKMAAIGQAPMLDGLTPSASINMAVQDNFNSTMRNHAIKMSSAALQAYKSEKAPMKDGNIKLEDSELCVDLKKASSGISVELSEGQLDAIRLAAQSIISGSNEIELDKMQENDAANMFAEEIKPLEHKQETDLIEAGTDDLDIIFNQNQSGLGLFNLDNENAIAGCDMDLQSQLAGTPPLGLLQSESELLQQDSYTNEDGLQEQDEEITFDDGQKEELGIDISNDDFDIEF